MDGGRGFVDLLTTRTGAAEKGFSEGVFREKGRARWHGFEETW